MRAGLALALVIACATSCVTSCGPSSRQGADGTPASIPSIAALDAGDAKVNVPPPRWALPSCPLAYEVANVEHQEMEGMPPSPGGHIETFMTIEARSAAAHVELRPAITVRVVRGRFRDFAVPDTGYAPVLLETDGARLTERDGPTMTFSALGTQGGIVWFFPDLPRSGAIGAVADWNVPRAANNEALRVEARRGARPGLKDALPQADRLQVEASSRTTPARVRLERWLELAGTRVAELTMTADADVEEKIAAMSVASRAHVTYRGTYLVTSAGRLLRAKVEKDQKVEMTFQGHEPQRHRFHAVLKAALVRACDGPTEPTLAVPLAPEERAIESFGHTWTAIATGERDRALAGFSPALRKKIGDARLWERLRAFTKERGERALGAPVLLGDEDVGTDGEAIVLTVHGITLDATRQTNLPVKTRVTMRESGGTHHVERLSAELELTNVNILRIE